ncbi:hypothetical protein MLD38_030309 [Melastoma candidum]|uniref:Uncharacterized protein n=1 Tax=Melastoma candidum TaxID=119954 RepID=A0ACB9MN51_9MYRT|nr:hypothetical protein MLD38_030309 [Melastoma candidum]
MDLEELSPGSPGKSANSSKEDEDGGGVLPGFRFHPTDQELVGFYLRRKMEKKTFSIELIRQVDIYKYDPWDLPKVSTVGDREWYFFCLRGRKYRNSVRPNRVTGSGFWKATGIDKPIYSSDNHQDCIGLKKSLVYYRGSAGKGTKTDWMMHEFRLPPSSPNKASANDASINDNVACDAEVWTICRILRRVPSHRKYMPTIRDDNNKVCSGKGNNSAGSTSKTSSHESGYTEQYLSFGESSIYQQNQISNHARVINERSYSFTNPPTSFITLQEPFVTGAYDNYTPVSFWNNNVFGGQSDYDYGNWDELRSVVDRARDPSFSYNL